MKQVTSIVRWCWSHKLRVGGVSLCTLIGAYVVVFTLVSCARSSTGQAISLPDGRSLAFSTGKANSSNGPRLILVHGAPADADAWNKLVRSTNDIKADEVIAVDRLGYGNSTAGDELTLAGHAASLEPLLVEVGGRKPILMGHSYGGPVVLRVAVDYADQIGGIILVAGACDAYVNDVQGFRRFIDHLHAIVPEPWALANRELLALTDENRAMEPLLVQVTCPVVIVHGTWDGVCPCDSTIAYLQDRLVNASEVRVVRLEYAGHNLHLSHVPELLTEINRLAVHTGVDTSTTQNR